MRKAIMALSCLLLFWGGWSFGQAQHGSDGDSWHTLSSVVQKFYVAGFTVGYASALMQEEALVTAKSATPEKMSSLKPAEKKEYEEILRWANRIVPSFG